jgi:hypothetical protein
MIEEIKKRRELERTTEWRSHYLNLTEIALDNENNPHRLMHLSNRRKRMKTALSTIKYLEQKGIEYKYTDISNVVTIYTSCGEYKLSLSTFKVRVGMKWIQKRKNKTLSIDGIVSFGKHKETLVSELSTTYKKWLMSDTEYIVL